MSTQRTTVKRLSRRILSWVTAFGLTPLSVLAAFPTDITGVKGKLCLVMDWFFTIALIVGIIYIMVAAFKYMTAGGQSEKVTSAHKALTYGVVGIAVAILAKAVPVIVGTFLDSGQNIQPC